MNCPKCYREIGGHVELGSDAYRRVARGCCPHCGCSMPKGYTVDFLRKPQPPRKIEGSELEDIKEKGKTWFIICLIFTLGGGFALGGYIGKGLATVGGVIAGIAYFVILSGIAYILYILSNSSTIYDSWTHKFYKSEDEVFSGAYAIFVGIVSIIIMAGFFIAYPQVFFSFLGYVVGIILILAINYVINLFSKK